jgi:ribonuclease HII
MTHPTRTHERQFWQQGLLHVAGIDEAGRGPWAGPVVAAAVILPERCMISGINDSKLVSATKRTTLADQILTTAIAWAVGVVDAHTIDKIGIMPATKRAMGEAITGLGVSPQALVIDAVHLDTPLPQLSLIRGDQLSLCIAAASILAKTHRDQLMSAYDELYPGYGFASHKGYGTARHQAALQQHGLTPIHRRSFQPMKHLI